MWNALFKPVDRGDFVRLLLTALISFPACVFSAELLAKEIVPAHVPLAGLQSYDVTAEFNTDVHLPPERRRWYFQNGHMLISASQILPGDSYCYLGTYGDMYEPKTYKRGEAYSKLELVTQVGSEIYLANRDHEAMFFKANREDLFVAGCRTGRADAKSALTAGDLYRHMGFNILLKSDSAPRDVKLIEEAAQAQPVTQPLKASRPAFRKLVFVQAISFPPRKATGYDGTRYIYQSGKLIEDNINFSGLDRRKTSCYFRFNEELSWKVTYDAGSEFVPARQYKLGSAVLLESDQYAADGAKIRSVRCQRGDGKALTAEDVIEAFGPTNIRVAQ